METNLFEQKSLLKTYLSMAMPVVFSMVLNIVYNIADTYFIARTQNTALVAAISLCGPVFTILMAFGNIFGQGGSSLISRLYGNQDTESAKRVSSFSFYIAIATGLVIAVLMVLFHKPLLYVLGADAETYSYAAPYFITMGIGAPFLVVSFTHMNFIRSEGLAALSTIGSVSGLIVNIILDPIFILVLNMGAFGAALASVLGYVFSDIFYLVIIIKKCHLLTIDPAYFKIPKNFIGQIFSVGISAAVANWMSSLCIIITNHFLLSYGNDQIAAMGLAMKVSMIAMLVSTGLVFGSAPIIGYFYGGHRYDKLKELLLLVLKVAGGITLLLSALLIVLARPAIGIFMKDTVIVTAGALMLRLQLYTMVLGVVIMLFTVCCQAAGLGFDALLISICRQGVIFILVIFFTSRLFGYNGVISAQAITDVITIVVTGLIFYKRFYAKLR